MAAASSSSHNHLHHCCLGEGGESRAASSSPSLSGEATVAWLASAVGTQLLGPFLQAGAAVVKLALSVERALQWVSSLLPHLAACVPAEKSSSCRAGGGIVQVCHHLGLLPLPLPVYSVYIVCTCTDSFPLLGENITSLLQF